MPGSIDTCTVAVSVDAMLRLTVTSALPTSSDTNPPLTEACGVSSSTMVTVRYWNPRDTGSKRSPLGPKSDDSSRRVKVSLSSAIESPLISNARGRV